MDRTAKNERDRLRHKDRTLKATFGIDLVKYQELLNAQGGKCVICRVPPRKFHRLAVDHCHTSGRIRDLLCSTCNTGIGMLKDDIRILERAADYLSTNGVIAEPIYVPEGK